MISEYNVSFQEGPHNISVFNMWTRTTGALESYNGVLGNRILKRGHFFKFVKVLIDEEFRHCRNFYTLMHGRDDRPHTKGNKYRIRGAKIMRNSELLLRDEITPEEFLNRIVYKRNNLDFALMNVECVNEVIDEDEEEDESGDDQSTSDFGRCITCKETEPELCILPCFDFCICEGCWNILKTNNKSDSIKCPSCNEIASDARKMNFVSANKD